MGRGYSPKDDEPDEGYRRLMVILIVVAVALACILVAGVAALYPDSVFTKYLIYALIGIGVVGFLFRGVIVRLARRM